MPNLRHTSPVSKSAVGAKPRTYSFIGPPYLGQMIKEVLGNFLNVQKVHVTSWEWGSKTNFTLTLSLQLLQVLPLLSSAFCADNCFFFYINISWNGSQMCRRPRIKMEFHLLLPPPIIKCSPLFPLKEITEPQTFLGFIIIWLWRKRETNQIVCRKLFYLPCNVCQALATCKAMPQSHFGQCSELKTFLPRGFRKSFGDASENVVGL